MHNRIIPAVMLMAMAVPVAPGQAATTSQDWSCAGSLQRGSGSGMLPGNLSSDLGEYGSFNPVTPYPFAPDPDKPEAFGVATAYLETIPNRTPLGSQKPLTNNFFGDAWGPGIYGFAPPRLYLSPGKTGSLRLKANRRDAQVFVDGFFIGVVDDYDGIFQGLQIDSLPHHVEVRATGYAPVAFDARIAATDTVTCKGQLRPAP